MVLQRPVAVQFPRVLVQCLSSVGWALGRRRKKLRRAAVLLCCCGSRRRVRGRLFWRESVHVPRSENSQWCPSLPNSWWGTQPLHPLSESTYKTQKTPRDHSRTPNTAWSLRSPHECNAPFRRQPASSSCQSRLELFRRPTWPCDGLLHCQLCVLQADAFVLNVRVPRYGELH